MNKIANWKIYLFLVIFGGITIAINLIFDPSTSGIKPRTTANPRPQKSNPISPPSVAANSPPPPSSPINSSPSSSPTTSQRAPMYFANGSPKVADEKSSTPSSKPLLWPADFKPTKVIQIPDPDQPSSGIFDLTFTPSDDFEFQVAQWWALKFANGDPPEIESSQNDILNFQREGTRTVRLRLKRFISRPVAIRLLVNRKNPDDYKPLPPVDPERFNNLLVSYRQLQGTRDNDITVDLDVENIDGSKSIAVAVHGPPKMIPSDVEAYCNLTDNEGTVYYPVDLMGLSTMNSMPSHLTRFYRKRFATSPCVLGHKAEFHRLQRFSPFASR